MMYRELTKVPVKREEMVIMVHEMEILDRQLMLLLILTEIYLLTIVVIEDYKNLILQDLMLPNMVHLIIVDLLDGPGV